MLKRYLECEFYNESDSELIQLYLRNPYEIVEPLTGEVVTESTQLLEPLSRPTPKQQPTIQTPYPELVGKYPVKSQLPYQGVLTLDQ